jgi:hypothetical protein
MIASNCPRGTLAQITRGIAAAHVDAQAQCAAATTRSLSCAGTRNSVNRSCSQRVGAGHSGHTETRCFEAPCCAVAQIPCGRKRINKHHGSSGLILRSKIRLFCALLSAASVSACRTSGGDSLAPAAPITSVKRVTLRVALSSGVGSSLAAGERSLDSGSVVQYSIRSLAGFNNPRVSVDGISYALEGAVRLDKSTDFTATADSVQLLSNSDSALIASVSRVAEKGDAAELLRRLGAMSDSLLLQLPGDSAVSAFERIINRAVVPERDAPTFVRALAISDSVATAARVVRGGHESLLAGIHTEIVYVNGILTNVEDFKLTWRGMLSPLAARGAGLTSAAGYNVGSFYNRTASAQDRLADEFFMCVRLKMRQFAYGLRSSLLTVPGCFPVGGITVAGRNIGDLAEALQQMINLSFANGNPNLVAIDAVRLANMIRAERRLGKRVMMVAHSQGNLLVSEALSVLRMSAEWQPNDFRCVAWVSVAPPRTPSAPLPMAVPTSFIVKGSYWEDILNKILVLSPGNESVRRLPNEQSETFDGQGLFLSSLSFPLGLSVGIALHEIVGSYLGSPRTAAQTTFAMREQVAHLNQSCPTSGATLSVSSNVSTSWVLQPDGIAGSGTSGSYSVRPLGNGSEYTLVPATVSGRTVVTTNSDGGGATIFLSPGQTKRITVTYTASAGQPRAPTNLSAVSSQGVVSLTWTAGSANQTSFSIERADVAALSFVVVGTTVGTVTTFDDRGAVANQTYRYRVRATNAEGVSAYGNEVVAGVPTGVCAPAIVVSEAITIATVWRAGAVGCIHYVVTTPVIVNSSLSIQPATNVRFRSGAALTVYGSLSAVGTAAARVTFAGEQNVRGAWVGLQFLSNSSANELSYVDIANGGAVGGSSSVNQANVAVGSNASLRITNSVVRESSGRGLSVSAFGVLADFSAVTLRDNTLAGLQVPASAVASLDPASDYLSGNGRTFLDVSADNVSGYESLPTRANHTWRITSLPIRIGNGVLVNTGESLTIEPGVNLIFPTRSGILVYGALSALGTSITPIGFAGEQNVRGAWVGLQFMSNTVANELSYVTVSNGGATSSNYGISPANVAVSSSGGLTLRNAALSSSAGWGLWVTAGGTVVPTPVSSGGNTFRDNALGSSSIP